MGPMRSGNSGVPTICRKDYSLNASFTQVTESTDIIIFWSTLDLTHSIWISDVKFMEYLI